MKIKTLGVKARDRELSLGKLNILSAPNGSGKSTICDALRFVGLGYVPALGKRPSDSAAIMAGREMVVTLTLDDGRTVMRTLEASGSGYVGGAAASWISGGKTADHAAAILALFGREAIDVEECLDVRALLGATPNERAKRIESLLASGRKSNDEMLLAVARATLQRLANVGDDRTPSKWQELRRVVPDAVGAALDELAPALASKVAECGIPGAVVWANEQKRIEAKGVKSRAGVRDELRTRLAGLPQPTKPDEIATLEDEDRRLEREAGAAGEKQKASQRRLAALVEARQKLELAQDAESDATLHRQQIVTAHGDEKALASAVAAADREIEGAKAPRAYAEPAAAKELEAEADRLDGTVRPVPARIDTTLQERRLDGLKAEAAADAANPWASVRVEARALAKVAGKTEAKWADAVRASAARLSTLANELAKGDADRLAAEIADAEKAIADATQAGAAREKDREKIEAGNKEALESAAECRAEARHIRNASASRAASEATAWRAANTVRLAKRNDLLEALSSLRLGTQRIEEAQREVGRLQATIAALEREQAEDVATSGGVAKPERSIDVRRRLADLRGAAAAEGQLRAVLAEIVAGEAREEAAAAIEWALQRAREQEIASAGGPLLNRMRLFLAAAGRTEEPYLKAGDGKCEVGWRLSDGRIVPAQALSGGEWCLYAGAMTAAIVALRAAPMRVLLLEAGETDETTFGALLAGVEALSDELTLAVVATQRSVGPVGEAWTIHEMGREPVVGIDLAAPGSERTTVSQVALA